MKFAVFAGLLATASIPLSAQNSAITQSIGDEHAPNEYTLACIEAPTQDCALSAALQTVIAEEFGLERSKILISVAKAMLATGKPEDAKQTLMLALDEARSVNLSLVLQGKITEVAPLLARAGDTASALALIEELNIRHVREDTLIEVARESVLAGRISDATVALSQMQNQQRATWQLPRLLPSAPAEALGIIDLAALEEDMREVDRSSLLYGGLIQLSVVADKRGESELAAEYRAKADTLFEDLVGAGARALAVAFRLKAQFDGGASEDLLRESYTLVQQYADAVGTGSVAPTVARNIGPVEAQLGDVDAALARIETFEELKEKADYFALLVTPDSVDGLSAPQAELLTQIEQVEGRYERDLLKLRLVEGAVANGAAVRALAVVSRLEDDDNQAQGLALVAPLLR